jgi:rhodanese-related sulfurtransferase
MLDIKQCELLKQMISEEGWSLVDVRTAAEYYHAHLPGATHWPLSDIARLDSNGKYLLYCRSGARSQTATDFLHMKGIDAINIGGFDILKKCLDS